MIRQDTKDTKQSDIVALFDKSSSFGDEEEEDLLFFKNLRPMDRLASQIATIVGELETEEMDKQAMATINEIKDTEPII